MMTLLAGLLAAGCADAGEDQGGDKNAPLIIVTSPDRGSRSGAETIVVEGRVSDEESGVASLTISGVEVSVDETGSFQAELALESGLNLLHLIATDHSGNQSSSTRAVLSGHFAPADESVRDAAQVYIGQQTLATIAETSEAVLDALDIDQLLVAANPVVSQGTSNCLNATVDLQDISYNDLEVTLEPVDGGIRALVQIVGLQAEARAFHTIACLGGSTALHVAANEVEVEAELQISVSGQELVAQVATSEARFDNLRVDVGILPSAVIEFVVGDFDRKLGAKVSELIAEALPAIVQEKISKFDRDHDLGLLGTVLQVSVKPSAVHFDESGGTVHLTTKITGHADGLPYLSNPMPLPSILADKGVSVAIADDALNQGLSALWDTGALNRRMELRSESGADIGGGIFDHIQLLAPLPPVIGAGSADRSLKLSVGDIQLHLLKGGEDKPISRIALSLELDIHVEEVDGQLKIMTSGEPTIYMERLGDGGFLNERDLEILVAFASNTLSGDLNRLLGEIPIPSYGGTGITGATVSAQDGYLQVGANLTR
jgi:hypothetical protein